MTILRGDTEPPDPTNPANVVRVTEIQRLSPEHAEPLRAFEHENRDYFAASVPDRGDDYFMYFEARHADLLAVQASGQCHFHVLVGDEAEVLGRVNLVDVADGSAELGYRIAERVTGHGLATAAVRRICALAATDYGLTELRASTTLDNAASRRVLARTGFVPVGETMPDGRPALRYLLDLRPTHDGAT